MRTGRHIKRAIKRAVKKAVGLVGGLSIPHQPMTRILTYHSVGSRDHEMNVTPDSFRAQMEWLAGRHAVIPLAEAAAGVPGVAITFDDGYRDNLLNAAPILRHLNFPATVFVVVGRAGGMLDHDDPDAGALMSWDELRALESLGIAIGAHSMTHRRLSLLNEEDQRFEIGECARLLEKHLGHSVEAFAYPFGSALDYNEISVRVAQESGFCYAVSNRFGPNPPGADRWTLRRIWIDATDDLRLFQAKVDGRLDALAALDSAPGIRLRRMLNRMLRA